VPVETDLQVDALLMQLAEAIERADPEQIAKTMARFSQQALRCKRIDPIHLKTLQDQVNRYDYEPALETIRKLIGSRQAEP
jgi:two-component system, sensor histidine kinase and response regulator